MLSCLVYSHPHIHQTVSVTQCCCTKTNSFIPSCPVWGQAPPSNPNQTCTHNALGFKISMQAWPGGVQSGTREESCSCKLEKSCLFTWGIWVLCSKHTGHLHGWQSCCLLWLHTLRQGTEITLNKQLHLFFCHCKSKRKQRWASSKLFHKDVLTLTTYNSFRFHNTQWHTHMCHPPTTNPTDTKTWYILHRTGYTEVIFSAIIPLLLPPQRS